jgi:hypothetical protein
MIKFHYTKIVSAQLGGVSKIETPKDEVLHQTNSHSQSNGRSTIETNSY